MFTAVDLKATVHVALELCAQIIVKQLRQSVVSASIFYALTTAGGVAAWSPSVADGDVLIAGAIDFMLP